MAIASDVLIDFGLNLAGYVVVGALIYVLTTLRMRRHMQSTAAAETAPAAHSIVTDIAKRPAAASAAASEFIPLVGNRQEHDGTRHAATATTETARPMPVDRQRNRRAIYEEARRLLAAGSTHADVVKRLPITEGEADMLSAIGQA